MNKYCTLVTDIAFQSVVLAIRSLAHRHKLTFTQVVLKLRDFED